MSESKPQKPKNLKKNQHLKFNSLLSNENTREETLGGIPHLVAGIIPLAEGVHNGIYYNRYAITAQPHIWNGIPVVINHPLADGIPTSANSPEQLDAHSVGRMFKTEAEDTRLKAEVWLDIAELDEKAPGLKEKIIAGENIEVSCSIYCDLEEWPGEFDGEAYTSSIYSLIPDHQALLPDSIGACSFEDGCGIRANSKSESHIFKDIVSSVQAFLSSKAPVDEENINNKNSEEQIMDIKSITEFLDNKDNAEVRAELLKVLSPCETEIKAEVVEKVVEPVIKDQFSAPETKTLSLDEYIDGIPCEDAKKLIQETLKAKADAKDILFKDLAKAMDVDAKDIQGLSTKLMTSMLAKFKTNDYSGNAASMGASKEKAPVLPEMNM